MHPYFNPTSREFIEDPYPFYRHLRENDPYYRSPFGFFALTRDSDVRTLLSDRRFGKVLARRTPQGGFNPVYSRPAMRSTDGWMLFKDPPDHTRLRGLVVKAFTAKRILEMRSRIQAIVDRHLDGIAAKGEADLVADFTLPIPSTVVFELLGIPPEIRKSLLDNIGSVVRRTDPSPLSPSELDRADTEHAVLVRLLSEVCELRRKQPADDLITQLVIAEDQGDRLTAEELIDNLILLLGAGFDSTTGLIGNALLALMRHPAELERLRVEPALVAGAVDEFLRYDASVQFTSRVALEQTELGGRTVPSGVMILAVLGSANRDPEVYEAPDRLDVTRRDIRPVSFGGGLHHCLGAQLARLEIEIAVGSIIRRFPGLRLDEREHPVRRNSMTLRALSRLPIMI